MRQRLDASRQKRERASAALPSWRELDNELGILKAASAPTGELSPLGTLIGTSLDECGFTPLPFGLCPGFPG